MPDIINDNIEKDGQFATYGGFPFISNIDTYVQNELTYRAEKRTRAAVPYIKITPGFSKDGSVSSKIVMKGIEAPNDRDPSTYQFNELYRPDAFYRPLAGVKSVNVDYKNAYGSTRKATISWVCHTLEDLERLSPYFLNPGYTVLIEWGWSDKAISAINNNPQINIENAFRYGKVYQKYTDGNYDCMLGVTTNYAFSMNRDGGFECTTEVISAGYLMEGMTIPNQFTTDATDARKRFLMSPAGGNNTEQKAEELINSEQAQKESIEKAKMQTLQYFLKESFHANLNLDIKNGKYQDINTPDDYFIFVPSDIAEEDKYLTADLDAKRERTVERETQDIEERQATTPVQREGADEFGPTAPVIVNVPVTDKDGNAVFESVRVTNTKDVTVSIRPETYISWGYIEDKVLNPHISVRTGNDKKSYFKFDSKDSKISMHSYLRTTNLGVCILPQWNDNSAPPVPDFKRNETSSNGYNYGYVRRILLNADWFRETMLNATTVLEGVLQVWSGINDACINYWNFKLKTTDQFYDDTKNQPETTNTNPDSVNQNILIEQRNNKPKSIDELNNDKLNNDDKESAIYKYSIIDINYADKVVAKELSEKGNIYMFRTKSFPVVDSDKKYTSIVRNLTFQSQLSSQAALNVFYSAQNADGKVMGNPQTNTFRSLYDYRIDGVKYNISKDTFSLHPLKIDTTQIKDNDVAREPGTSVEVELQDQAPYGMTLTKFLPMAGSGYRVKQGDIELTGIEGMKMLVLMNDAPYPSIVSTALVPLNCELELEGVSGVRIGNIFTLDHLPQIYRTKGVFQVIGITDTIDKNSWVTKLKSQFRVFNDINYEQIRSGVSKSTGRTSNVNLGSVTEQDVNLFSKEIQFKHTDDEGDFGLLSTNNPKLREVLLNANAYSVKYFDKPIVVTDIARTHGEQSNLNPGVTHSKHITWEAADLRSSIYTTEQVTQLTSYLELIADKVLYHQVDGGGLHFHITVNK